MRVIVFLEVFILYKYILYGSLFLSLHETIFFLLLYPNVGPRRVPVSPINGAFLCGCHFPCQFRPAALG